ncbi:MAG: M20 family metallopeptidase [Planctomycetota bacterium]|jgi:succinyl-diaminopimelate desuccinylase
MKELLKRLIQAESTAGKGELAAANVLADFLGLHGINCRVDKWDETRANLIGHIKSSGERDALLFAAHLDVVPPGQGEWKLPPFGGFEADGRVHGRGATDMKGPVASLAAAIAEIVESGTRLKGDIILAATAGEETDSCGAKRFIEIDSADLPALAGVIVPEPTDFEVATCHRGMLWLEMTTFGKSAHGSMPHLGVNAIERMSPLLNRLGDYQPAYIEHPLLGKCSVSINEIHGGKAANVVPDRCSVKIDIRTVPGQTNQEIIGDLEEICSELKKSDPRFEAQIEIIRFVPALETDIGGEFVRTFCDLADAVKGGKVDFSTDGPFFAELGAPVIVFGPGKSSVCHQPDEYIDVADLEKGKEYFKKIILKFLT